MSTVLVFARAQMGDGDPVLGRKILATFLRKSVAIRDLRALLFYNDGVRLVAPDSPVLAELALLEERGVDLIPCGTCLEFHKLAPAAGKTGNMDQIVQEMDKADKVIAV
jgi:hypothetical protein